LINAPGLVNPKVGKHYLLFLLPTKFEGVFASITAPFDDNQGIFILDRADGEYDYHRKGLEEFPVHVERYNAIWSVVNEKGEITPAGVTQLRQKYRAELAVVPPKDAVIHLNWKKERSESEWQWNVPVEDKKEAKPATHGRPARQPMSK
jgi:hypothetical protein